MEWKKLIALSMSNLLSVFNPNNKGTDYICSDIHGHFSLLESLLEQAGFDENTDRLFSLGDLIDRGPESDLALSWLEKKWFYAIQGNHERMLINAVERKSSHMFTQWYAWGGAWAEDLNQTRLEEFYRVFSQLPIAIELHVTNANKVALVHAELPDKCDWLDVVAQLNSTPSNEPERNLLISNMLWAKTQPRRNIEGILSIEPVKNIDHVFHGHTIVDYVTTYTNRTFMDLGSYLNDSIGLVKPVDYV
jgi:serine/threonine protein phosphatase 1